VEVIIDLSRVAQLDCAVQYRLSIQAGSKTLKLVSKSEQKKAVFFILGTLTFYHSFIHSFIHRQLLLIRLQATGEQIPLIVRSCIRIINLYGKCRMTSGCSEFYPTEQ